jgi:hypothetical protein
MKRFKMNKYLVIALGVLVAAVLFFIGKGSGHEHYSIAEVGAAVALTQAEKDGFNENEQKVILAVKKLTVQMKEQLEAGTISKEGLAAAISGIKMEIGGDATKTLKEQFEELKQIAKAQGTTLTELGLKYNGIETGNKSIAQVLEENKEDLKRVYQQGSGTKHFMIQLNHKGEFVARPFDPTKAAGPHATIADVGTNGNTSSIAQSIDAVSLLRLGGDAPIISQYRNTPWIFDLCNMVNAGFEMPLAMWYEESVKQGASATVAEGGSKPLSQYAYTLKTDTYKKEATLLGFTEEFQLDFARLQSDILGKGRVDLINRINAAVLVRLTAAATAYNTSASFGPVVNANDFDVLAAMAAQVDNSTFGATANGAVMSTFKKYAMGVIKDQNGNYVNRPKVLDPLAFVGNPGQSADNVMVGDFKQYNILLRGGLIVKVGYNGTDFAENRFSVVLEQFYYDYISAIRAVAIVKGPDFATIKAALNAV